MNQVSPSNPSESNVQEENLKPLLHYFYEWEKNTPNNTFLRQPVGAEWTTWTWKEAAQEIRSIAAALKAYDLPEKSNIGIVSKNSPHWIMSDIAITMAGHVSVPFYPTLNDEKLNQVLEHSECEVLFVGKLDDWPSMKEGIPGDMRVITYPESPAESDDFAKWDALRDQHAPLEGQPLPKLDDFYTIIYTSGTTGMPKGVMHKHRNFINVVEATKDVAEFQGDCRFFSYLPLCHVAERVIVETAALYSGGSISFAESLDTFAQNLSDTQPTHFLAVPRIWTKFYQGVLAKMPQSKLDLFLKIPILSSMVKNKIKKSLGLAKARVIITGAAPMPSSLLSWYHKLGIVIREAYGMTENVGVCTSMRPDKIKVGTVGQPYPSTELKIDPKTQEVLMKADWVMDGYFKEPKKSNETVKDGWLHTGDMGEIDSEGFLKITGRVKDQFKGAKGEFIVPGPIENGYASNNNLEQVCIVGRGLPQPVALVVLSEGGMKMDKDNIQDSLEATRTAINSDLLAHEKVKKVIIAKEPWTVENNCLTPTLKIKRNVLEQVYGERLEKWYEEKDSIIWE